MSRYVSVLVTRPQPQADELAARLARSGIPALLAPAFRFEAMPKPPVWPDPDDDGSRSLWLFTSPRAVAFGLPLLGQRIPAQARLGAIGPATAASLEEAGRPAWIVAGGQHTSEDLLADPRLRERQGTAFIVTAPGGRGWLGPGLERLGWAVRTLDVYCRVPLAPPPGVLGALAESGPVISAWTSGNAMEALLGQLGEASRRAVTGGLFVVASARLQAMAIGLGARQVTIANSASNAHLRAAIIEAWQAGADGRGHESRG
ncbi:uroporphyrinogen-III synthase [Marinihelvus fidelis]|uniref:Uroporphyrinogen-III synthase n=1 Tax=Marinihelvus fidelis TaxID=2613842 RepID=A0A5N0T720_9GAMM|nr:uroporphyrinogen-III synthase [Marinihelvus fidelis]KAA9130845.1 uroporphyrinogen-III synthase [Marinihelvus fidelis]